MVAALVAAGAVDGRAEPARPAVDVHPVERPTGPAPEVSDGVVEQVGQIMVMQGDAETVTDLGAGDYGIDIATQLPNITMRFYLNHGDEFDGIAIFTTFPDQLQGGAAYSVGPGAGTMGIGYDAFGPGTYGSAGRLVSVVNMNDVANYGKMDESDRWFATTMGQEFGHSWLSHIQFRDPVTMQPSNELLGRDGSHWSAIFDSGSSVMDGVTFTDNGDGTFTAGEYASKYGPLDLYAMGIIAPDEVGPLYIIRDARYADNNQAVNRINDGWTGVLSPGRVITGTKVEFSIDDIIAVHGPRVPAWDAENEDWRVAFVLVTRPGETTADLADKITKLETGRITWETKHRQWSLSRSTMCTDLSAPCPLAIARVDQLVAEEDPDDSDGDGIIEPGERVRLRAVIANDGTEDATDAEAELATEARGVTIPGPETLPPIPAGQSIEHPFYLEIDGEACGQVIDVDLRARIAHRAWKGTASFRPGLIDAAPETFATDAGWQVNVDSRDVTVSGAWAHAVGDATYFAGRTLQPNGGAGGPTDAAWFTDPAGAWDAGELTGKSSLYSGPIDVTGMYQPIVRFKLWYLALDRELTQLTPSTIEHLVIEASTDGETWIEIDRVGGEPARWVDHESPLPVDFDTSGGELQLRFVAEDLEPVANRIVEIGIDDVAIVSLSPACADAGDDGCGCRSADPAGAAALLGLTLLGLAAVRRRRR